MLVGCSAARESSPRTVATRAASPVAERGATAAATPRTVTLLDLSWAFHRGEVTEGQVVGLDERAWRQVDLPHDWSIEGPFARDNPTDWRGGYLPSGVAWYRRHLCLAPRVGQERAYLDFDGAMANAQVWVNGVKVGGRRWGYLGFRCDITDAARWGADNVIAVRTDTSAQPASRWYTGAGIYRHVWLVRTGEIHVAHWGTSVTTPEVSAERARVRVRARIENHDRIARDAHVEVTLSDPDGAIAGKATLPVGPIAPTSAVEFEQDIIVPAPRRWSPETPAMYYANLRVSTAGRETDSIATPFGIREARFEPATGFWLNGVNLKLKGVCMHHDAGGLGAAVPLRVWEARLDNLRLHGVNAIRTSHNPVAPEFLDLCDRKGFLVMHEAYDAWTRGKTAHDADSFRDDWRRDLTDLLRRDRNHPSIVIYSAGNEIHDVLYDPPLGLAVFRELREVYHAVDPTRQVTVAVNQPERSRIHQTGFADLMDVAGYNYREQYSVDERRLAPARRIIGTENAKQWSSWRVVRDNPDLAGMFLWTGYDYIGESVRRWPFFTFEFGMFDFSGNPRPVAGQFKAYWTTEPVVSVARLSPVPPLPSGTKIPPDRLADWNPPLRPGEIIDLEVYSNCAAVEMFLNGRSLGTRDVPADASPLRWPTVYEPGELRVVGKVSERGKVVCESTLRTAGKPHRVELTVDRATLTDSREDVAYLSARIVDEHGVTVPDADTAVLFEISGPAKLLATESADLKDHTPFGSARRPAFRGRCTAIYRGTHPGDIRITATAKGLAPGTVTFTVTPAPVTPASLPTR